MKFDPARFVRTEIIENGARYSVGAGDSRIGQRGLAIGIGSLRHAPCYEIILQLDSGTLDSFAPMQLFVEVSA